MQYPVTPPRYGTKRHAPYPSRRESIEPLLGPGHDVQDSPSPFRVAHGSPSPGETLRECSMTEWRHMASHGTTGFSTPQRPQQRPGPKQPSPEHARTSAVSPWLKYEPYVPMPPPPLPRVATPTPAPRRRLRPEGGLFPGGLGAVGVRFQEGLDACTSTLRRVASTSMVATLPPSPPSPHARRECQTVPIMARRKAYQAQKIAIPSILRPRRRRHGSTSPKKSPKKISPETKARILQKLVPPSPPTFAPLESPFRLRN